MQQEKGIWRCCSGPEPTGVHGMKTPVPVQPKKAIWKSYSGPELTDVPGMQKPFSTQPKKGIWRSYSGHAITDAPWTNGAKVFTIPLDDNLVEKDLSTTQRS
jgi:hypothetical protein